MVNTQSIQCEVVYAPTATTVVTVPLTVPHGTTVGEVLHQADLLEKFALDLTINKIGIWNRHTSLGTIVNDGDRIEIYRPLLQDPKDLRRIKLANAKTIKQDVHRI